MLVSLNWLQHYVDISEVETEDLAERITKSGVEVDGLTYIGEPVQDVVVGYVESCEKHPHADKLSVCMVDTGKEKLQIICGAANIRAHAKVAVALPGTVLPGGFQIEKVDLRGVESNGMICSLHELGFDEEHIPKAFSEGIYIFPHDVGVGEDVQPLLNINDAVFEFDLTPNRADCLNMLGVAYEVAAILDIPVNLPDIDVQEASEQTEEVFSVQVENTDDVPYYGIFMIQDITVKASPLWMQNYLLASGIRPINNVVDITNYVLMEYGQPLHAFDRDRLKSDEIVVRPAEEAEKITTLDGEVRSLQAGQIVITDGKDPIALAGVMGGQDTEVHEGTTTILLEAALFDAFSIRKTVAATGLRSEASNRYEKGIDPARVHEAGKRACQLLAEYADATVLSGVASSDTRNLVKQTVKMDPQRINERLGTNITLDEMKDILRRLRFDYRIENDSWHVEVPTRRGDITIFEDMVEEIARIYGYDNLPYTLPEGASAQTGGLTEKQELEREIHHYMQGAGLDEAITYSLVDETSYDLLVSPDIKARNPRVVPVAKPMSEDHHYLRISLLPELLRTLQYNVARKQENIALYEFGNIFLSTESPIESQPDEEVRLSGAFTGKWLSHEWQRETKYVDFYVVKGIVEGFQAHLDLAFDFVPRHVAGLHPGRCAVIMAGNEEIGVIGEVHPALEAKMDLDRTYVFDLNIDACLKKHNRHQQFQPIPRYPSITRDIAFIVDEEVQAGDIQRLIRQKGSGMVKQVEIFDVYTGENLSDGKKSIAFRLLYQHPDRTLTDEEIEASYQEITDEVNETFDAYVRS